MFPDCRLDMNSISNCRPFFYRFYFLSIFSLWFACVFDPIGKLHGLRFYALFAALVLSC